VSSSAATGADCKLQCNLQACDPTRPDPTRPDTVANNVLSRIDICDHEVHLQLRSLFQNTTILKTVSVSFHFVCSVHSTDLKVLRLQFSRNDVTAILATI